MSGIKYSGGTYSGSLIAVIDTDDVRHLLSVTEITAADMTLTVAGVTVGGTQTATLTLPAALAGNTVSWDITGAAASIPDNSTGLSVVGSGVSVGSATLTATVAGIEKSVTVNVTEAAEDNPGSDELTKILYMGLGETDPTTGIANPRTDTMFIGQSRAITIKFDVDETINLASENPDYNVITVTLVRYAGWSNTTTHNGNIIYAKYECIGNEWKATEYKLVDNQEEGSLVTGSFTGVDLVTSAAVVGETNKTHIEIKNILNKNWESNSGGKITIVFSNTNEVS